MKKIISSLFVLLMFVSLYTNNANAGDRMILVERFTSSTCYPCALANPTLDAFIQNADPNRLTNISYHMNWPAPGNDPMYLINPNDNNARRTLYGVNSIPDWFFDGVINVGTSQSDLQNAYNQRTDILSPVSLVVSENTSGNQVTVKADVYCEGFLSNPNATLQFAVVEKVVYYNGTNGETSYTYVLRRFLPNASGTLLTLLPGDKVTQEFTYTMDPAWNPDLIETLVFVQGRPFEILNAAYVTRDFNLVSSPGFKVLEHGIAGSGNFEVKIPQTAEGYNSPVTFTAQVIPATPGINIEFTGGNTISTFPGTLNAIVTSTAAVPVGEYQIVFTGTNGNGVTHKTFTNYLVGKNYITVGNSRPSLTYKVDGVEYTSSSLYSWDINSSHVIEAVSPQTVGNNRYVFENWSNGGNQTQTITINSATSNYTANYKIQYRLLGSVVPAGLPVTVNGSGSFLDSASNNDITLSAVQVSYNGKTYYFSNWEGTGSGSYTGPNTTANITMNGFIFQKAIFDTIDVGISNYNSQIPDKFSLYQNYPNPFNPVTNIKFDIAKSTNTSIVIYDMLGKEISSLVNQVLAPGSYQYSFNASNFPSGIYYYRIKTNEFTDIRKMILLK
ncbi:MAG TPA: Omp28-related outer membrane protein [Ignavibacteria bacterium]|nr:Omp28-related outer membrane protein [Ignavibacteria bacterium]HMR41761.1 Omp28-related outer membrane protein [Ignavibacteria bacterium]